MIAAKLLKQDGSPASVEEVVLAPGFGGFGELLGGTFFTLISAGLVCLADSPPELCEVFRGRAQTGEVRARRHFLAPGQGQRHSDFLRKRKADDTDRTVAGRVVGHGDV